MKQSDMEKFTALWVATSDFYGKVVADRTLVMAFKLLSRFELNDIQAALESHMVDPDAGRFMPKPADIVGKIQQASTDQWPGPEEAWAMFPRDESQSACVTQEMLTAWGCVNGIDEIPARMAFKERYAREVQISQQRGKKPQWVMTLGHDKIQREESTLLAIECGRLTAEAAIKHLPSYRMDELRQLTAGQVSVAKLIADDRRQENPAAVALIARSLEKPADPATAREHIARIKEILNGNGSVEAVA